MYTVVQIRHPSQTLTNFYNIWQMVFATQRFFSDLLISATYCCYIYIGETFINCTVITSAIKVAHYRCTNWTNIQFIHTTSLHLSLNITENVQNGFIAIHTGLKSLKPFINIVVQKCFSTSHSNCQSSAASDLPRFELASDTDSPALRPIFDSQLEKDHHSYFDGT